MRIWNYYSIIIFSNMWTLSEPSADPSATLTLLAVESSRAQRTLACVSIRKGHTGGAAGTERRRDVFSITERHFLWAKSTFPSKHTLTAAGEAQILRINTVCQSLANRSLFSKDLLYRWSSVHTSSSIMAEDQAAWIHATLTHITSWQRPDVWPS